VADDIRFEVDESQLRFLLGVDGPIADDLQRRLRNVAKAQEQRAPVLTGEMRDSVTIEPIEEDSDGLYGDVGPTARTPEGFPYPQAVEHGWTDQAGVHHVARPFVRPSIDAAKK
jgi:hypothetical protein